MSLAVGSQVGPYEIAAQIGASGMGVVYRARDTKLGRDVAIKVLPDAFAGDAERLARFEREARALAGLNHPNIATLHGIEESPATGSGQPVRALVMELVEGQTLAERTADGALPVDEALRIARQIAEALQAANVQGIVHRDLKPANVKLRPDGVVKVLDFGLAKALGPPEGGHYERGVRLQPDLTASPTLSVAATQAGVILGTAAYMAPEQAKGKPAAGQHLVEHAAERPEIATPRRIRSQWAVRFDRRGPELGRGTEAVGANGLNVRIVRQQEPLA
jgi:serine/threonine-protein kinase